MCVCYKSYFLIKDLFSWSRVYCGIHPMIILDVSLEALSVGKWLAARLTVISSYVRVLHHVTFQCLFRPETFTTIFALIIHHTKMTSHVNFQSIFAGTNFSAHLALPQRAFTDHSLLDNFLRNVSKHWNCSLLSCVWSANCRRWLWWCASSFNPLLKSK